MSYKIPYKRNKNSILLCQSHCVLKTMHLKAACCWAHSSGVIIADYTLSSEAGFSMCGWAWVSLCEGLAVSPATPQSWLRKRRIPRWPSGAALTADTHIHEHTETHTELWAPWQFHSWEQWRPHCRDPENTPQLPDRKAQIVNGDHTHFPMFKGSLFSTSLPHL